RFHLCGFQFLCIPPTVDLRNDHQVAARLVPATLIVLPSGPTPGVRRSKRVPAMPDVRYRTHPQPHRLSVPARVQQRWKARIPGSPHGDLGHALCIPGVPPRRIEPRRASWPATRRIGRRSQHRPIVADPYAALPHRTTKPAATAASVSLKSLKLTRRRPSAAADGSALLATRSCWRTLVDIGTPRLEVTQLDECVHLVVGGAQLQRRRLPTDRLGEVARLRIGRSERPQEGPATPSGPLTYERGVLERLLAVPHRRLRRSC